MVISVIALSLAEIQRLSEIVDGVEGRHERVVLIRNGRRAAVIISSDELEALEETLDLLSDPEALREIRRAEAAIESGDTAGSDKLRHKYLQR